MSIITLATLQLCLLNCLQAYSAYLTLTGGAYSFAYVAFIGLGAYTTAILSVEHGFAMWETLLIAPCASALIALLIFGPLERLAGVYLAIASVGLVGLFQVLLVNLSGLTRGAIGISGIPFSVDTWMLVLGVVVLALALRQFERSNAGQAVRAMRLDPLLAGSLGVDTRRIRLLLSLASAALAAASGVLSAHYFGYVGAEQYSFSLVITLLAMVILGGVGHWAGPPIGAVVFTLLPQWLEGLGEWRNFMTGAILVVIVIVARDGLTGVVGHGWYAARRRASVRRRGSARDGRGDGGSQRAPVPAMHTVADSAPVEEL